MSLPEPVNILYNIPRSAAGAVGGPWTESDSGVLQEVEAVAESLARLGVDFRRVGVRTLLDIPASLSFRGTLVFNLVESLQGAPADVNGVPVVCSSLGTECTGGATPCLDLCQDKARARAVLADAGVPTPFAAFLPVGTLPPDTGLPAGRLIVKPVRADAGEGIDDSSVLAATDTAGIAAAVARVHREMRQAVLLEQYIDGREFNVSILERNGKPEVLPLAEIEFCSFPPGKPRIVGYAAKWLTDSFEYIHTKRVVPARISEELAIAIRRVALAAWYALDCRDYVRVDIRVDPNGTPLVLEVNPNPDISPDAGFAAALAAAGLSYDDFVGTVLANAQARLHSAAAAQPAPAAGPDKTAAGAEGGQPLIRWSTPADRDPIVAAIEATGFFRTDEIAIAVEVLEESLAKGPPGHYQSYSAVVDGQPVGWVSIGPTPCTVGTYDIYWIVTHPHWQGRGIGSRLLAHAESVIAARGGRIATAETSSRAQYEPTRRFYERHGYLDAARVKDFYDKGDDKVIFAKRFEA